MSEITGLFEDTVDEFSYRAGYDQCKIDDLQKVQVALDVIKYLVRENRALKERLGIADD